MPVDHREREGQTAVRLKTVRSIGRSVHWRSVKYPVISLIVDTTANKVNPYLSIRSLISTSRWNSEHRFSIFNRRDTVLKGICMVGYIRIEVSPAFGGG